MRPASDQVYCDKVFTGDDTPGLDGNVRERRPKRHHTLLQRLIGDQLVDGGDVASVEDLIEVTLDDYL